MVSGVKLSILSQPCDACPFVGRFPLSRGRLKEIMESTQRPAHESYFVCHKTVDYADEEQGSDAVYGPAKVCAGWMEAVSRVGTLPAVIQVAERLDLVERSDP